MHFSQCYQQYTDHKIMWPQSIQTGRSPKPIYKITDQGDNHCFCSRVRFVTWKSTRYGELTSGDRDHVPFNLQILANSQITTLTTNEVRWPFLLASTALPIYVLDSAKFWLAIVAICVWKLSATIVDNSGIYQRKQNFKNTPCTLKNFPLNPLSHRLKTKPKGNSRLSLKR